MCRVNGEGAVLMRQSSTPARGYVRHWWRVSSRRSIFLYVETPTFTERIAGELRAELARQRPHGRTMTDMAARTGLALTTVQRRLSGESPINTDELALMCTYLHLAPDTLVRRALLEAVA